MTTTRANGDSDQEVSLRHRRSGICIPHDSVRGGIPVRSLWLATSLAAETSFGLERLVYAMARDCFDGSSWQWPSQRHALIWDIQQKISKLEGEAACVHAVRAAQEEHNYNLRVLNPRVCYALEPDTTRSVSMFTTCSPATAVATSRELRMRKNGTDCFRSNSSRPGCFGGIGSTVVCFLSWKCSRTTPLFRCRNHFWKVL